MTLFVRNGAQSIWENGIFQNCYFLAELLSCSPLVKEVCLVNGNGGTPESGSAFLALAPVPVVDLNRAMDTLDVVIEMSAQLNPDWTQGFRARGGRLVAMRVANDYVIDIERMTHDLPSGLLALGSPYHAVWTLPAFERTCAPYYEMVLNAPVRAMPHLWGPELLETTLGDAAPSFQYVPGRQRWRVAIVEPNLCMVKSSHLPMLVVDLAHRQDPTFIDHLKVHNAMALKDDPRFVSFARSLDLVCHGKATVESRVPIFELMNHTEAIVSHHWENGQNYLYYEVLYGGYPLIHNSDWLLGCGYRYANFDCQGGATALRRAFAEHDEQADDYRREARAFLTQLHPHERGNVERYTEAIEALYA
ncbi:DUF2827 domain-containing protein [Burkholderia cepacia]|uniref:DUF2827 domain-containing protein n=1 Tax=Burkholderia cepacia TaxID=292 RepID=UPI00280AD5FC|nr:DUF2827 domain-containing protein [Burkholderia cepacia]